MDNQIYTIFESSSSYVRLIISNFWNYFIDLILGILFPFQFEDSKDSSPFITRVFEKEEKDIEKPLPRLKKIDLNDNSIMNQNSDSIEEDKTAINNYTNDNEQRAIDNASMTLPPVVDAVRSTPIIDVVIPARSPASLEELDIDSNNNNNVIEEDSDDDEDDENDHHNEKLPFEVEDFRETFKLEADKEFHYIVLSPSLTNETHVDDDGGEAKAHKKKRRRRGKKKSAKEKLALLQTMNETEPQQEQQIINNPIVDLPSSQKNPQMKKQKQDKEISSKSNNRSRNDNNKKNNHKDEPTTSVTLLRSGAHLGKHEAIISPRRFSHSVLSHPRDIVDDLHSEVGIRPIRQPFGPSLKGNGFSEEYQNERRNRWESKSIPKCKAC